MVSNLLYAPWREEYYNNKNIKTESKNRNTCIFCKIKKNNLILIESKRAYVCANKYPYAGGHLLVIPKRHVQSIIDLTSLERVEIFKLIDFTIYALKLLMNPDGYNVGCNIGEVAGESINHLHFHILPRFQGDVGWNKLCNFEVISTKPEDLIEELTRIIKKYKLKTKFKL